MPDHEPTATVAHPTSATPTHRRSRCRPRNFHLGVVIAGFFGLRAALWATGLRFQDHLVGQLQLIDEPLLREDPFRAFTTLHTQPPLWNFYVGAVRRWSPLPDALTFQVVWVLIDLATICMLWSILRHLGARRWQATVASILVASSPLFILSESTLRYEAPVTFIITASVYTLARYVRSGRTRYFAGFVMLLSVGVLTRTLLQFLWMLGGMALILVIARHRHLLKPRLVAIPVALVCLIGADLAFVHHRFDTYGYSSHVGSNLKRIAITTLPEHRLDELVAAGTVSETAVIKPFSPYAAYAPYLPRCDAHTLDPALAEATKSTGEPNLDHICFLPVYRQDFDDSIAAMRAEPGNYAANVARATLIFSSWPVDFDKVDTRSFDLLETIYKPLLVPVHLQYSFGGGDPQNVARIAGNPLGQFPFLVTAAAGLLLAIVRGLCAGWRGLRGRASVADPVSFWIGYTVISVMAAGVLFDVYENARFRQGLDPIILGPLFVAVLAGATHLTERTRSRRARDRDQPNRSTEGPSRP